MEGPSAGPSAPSAPSGEDQPGQQNKSPAVQSLEDTSGPSSWQTDSLASSWATVGTLDPEEAKSLEASEALLLAEERSENHSSISDIVHLEREEAELLEEAERQGEDVVGGGAEELQSSVMSVLGTEKELAELRVEQVSHGMRGDMPHELKAPKTMDMLMSVEEPELQEEPEEVVWPLLSSTPPSAIPEPPVSAPLPVPPMLPPVFVDPEFQPLREVPPSPPKLEQQPSTKPHKESQEQVKKEEKKEESKKELPIPSGPSAPPVDTQKESQTEPVAPLAEEESFDISTKEIPVTQEAEPPVPPPSAFELTTLLYGSAAVVAVMGMVAFGALALSRK